jgi:hypothetical protein
MKKEDYRNFWVKLRTKLSFKILLFIYIKYGIAGYLLFISYLELYEIFLFSISRLSRRHMRVLYYAVARMVLLWHFKAYVLLDADRR